MALVSMFIVISVIIALILGLIFIAGTVLLIIGLVKRKKSGSTGDKKPKALIVSGSVMLAIPTVITLVFIVLVLSRMIGFPFGNNTLPERWQHSWVHDKQAANQAITELLSSSDDSDKERFKSCFAKELRDDPDFEKYIEDYFSSYPIGLSECELGGGEVQSEGSYDYGHNTMNGYTHYECEMNDEYYFITLNFCFENTDEPDKVGVTYFSVRNLEAEAAAKERDYDYDYENDHYNTPYVFCSLISSSEINARLINGDAYIWTETENKKLSADEMKNLLDRVVNLNDDLFIKSAGKPNTEFNPFSSTGWDYYYELQPENGEPRYAHIVTSTQYGRIIEAHLCTPYETDYNYSLCPYRKPTD